MICMPTATGPPAVPTSTKDVCSECQQEVWVSPGSRLAADRLKAVPICIECAKAQGAMHITQEQAMKQLQPEQLPEVLSELIRIDDLANWRKTSE